MYIVTEEVVVAVASVMCLVISEIMPLLPIKQNGIMHGLLSLCRAVKQMKAVDNKTK